MSRRGSTMADQIRDALIDAAAAGDERRLAELCAAHRDEIRRDFPSWTRVPETVRADPAAVQRYGGGLVAVAQCFAARLGDPSLLDRLRGPDESNPVIAWQRSLGQARALMGEARFGVARTLLAGALAGADGLQGSAVASLLPITHGMLGECCLQLGEAGAAIEPTVAALRLCEAHGDIEGVLAYLGNLFEIQRYLGQPGHAATTAERYAAALESAGHVGHAVGWRRRAARVRAGEPPNRVVAVVDGERHELADLGAVSGDRRVEFVFERNRLTLEPARRRAGDGERLGGEGRHAEALDAFREAARLDPFDPHSRYLAGLALLQLGRHGEAVAEYEATERLAPGWFNCRADLWLARELASGAMTAELYRMVYLLEDAPAPPQEKVRLADAALRTAPGLAPLHLFRGHALRALGAPAEAASAYRNGLTYAAEPDFRSRLLSALGMTTESAPERTAALGEAAALPGGNLIAAAMATVALRTS
ncbi:tetratricopeptide repeat protein [Dactylosporangium darangshiense]